MRRWVVETRPLAVQGLVSYRYPREYGSGWIMIGARSDAEALSEANRSLSSAGAEIGKLQVWCESINGYREVGS